MSSILRMVAGGIMLRLTLAMVVAALFRAPWLFWLIVVALAGHVLYCLVRQHLTAQAAEPQYNEDHPQWAKDRLR